MQEATKKSGGHNRRRNNARRVARKSKSWAECQARRDVRRVREFKRQRDAGGSFVCRVRPFVERESIIVQNADAIPENWRDKRLKLDPVVTNDGPRLRVALMGFGELGAPVTIDAPSRRNAVQYMKARMGADFGAYECLRK